MKTFYYEEEYIFVDSDEAEVLSLMRIKNLTVEEAVRTWIETLDTDESLQADKVYDDIVNYLTRKYEIC